MSNPGVLVLTEKKLGRGVSFRVEDNLGEAIHFHYKNIRVDLSVNELFEVAEVCNESIRRLIPAEGFDPDDYDDDFLMKYSGELTDLKGVREKTISVKKLRYIEKNKLGIPLRKSICSYRRKEKKKDSKKHTYLPVVFNDEPVLMYGIEEAWRCYKRDPEAKIRVKCLSFENNKYSAPKHPVLKHFFCWDKSRIIETLYSIATSVLHI